MSAPVFYHGELPVITPSSYIVRREYEHGTVLTFVSPETRKRRYHVVYRGFLQEPRVRARVRYLQMASRARRLRAYL